MVFEQEQTMMDDHDEKYGVVKNSKLSWNLNKPIPKSKITPFLPNLMWNQVPFNKDHSKTK